MKKLVILCFGILLLSSFIIAENYEGDGTYVLKEGDSVTTDNNYQLVLTGLEGKILGTVNSMATYSFELYQENIKLDDLYFDTYNFGTYSYLIDSPGGESAINITFISGMTPSKSEVSLKSLSLKVGPTTADGGVDPTIAVDPTTEDEDMPDKDIGPTTEAEDVDPTKVDEGAEPTIADGKNNLIIYLLVAAGLIIVLLVILIIRGKERTRPSIVPQEYNFSQ